MAENIKIENLKKVFIRNNAGHFIKRTRKCDSCIVMTIPVLTLDCFIFGELITFLVDFLLAHSIYTFCINANE